MVHKLDRRSGSVRQDGLGLLHRADFFGFIRHVVDDDGRHGACRILRLVDESRRARAGSARQRRVGRSDR